MVRAQSLASQPQPGPPPDRRGRRSPRVMKLTLVVRADLRPGPRQDCRAGRARRRGLRAGEPRHAGLPGLAAGRLTAIPAGGTARRPLRFVPAGPLAADPCRRPPGHGPHTWRRFGHAQDMETDGRLEFGVCAAVDVHYLSTGGARAAAVLAADAAFAHVLAERTASYPGTALPAGRVLPARTPAAARGPGRSERAGPAGGRRLRRPGPRRPAGRARTRTPSSASR